MVWRLIGPYTGCIVVSSVFYCESLVGERNADPRSFVKIIKEDPLASKIYQRIG